MIIEASTLRVLNNGIVIGSGFLVSKNLIATCAHVVQAAGATPGENVTVRLSGGKEVSAFVEPQFWCDPNSEDISILRLSETVESVQPVTLGSSTDSKGHRFSTFGFPNSGQEITGAGTIVGYAFLDGVKLLQLDSRQVTPGFSGGAVYDEETKRVVGMVVAILPPDEYQRQGTTALAVPSDALWQVCTEIRPSDIAPYRGLQTFTEETADFFFGREAVTEKLLHALHGGCRFLAVFGASGSGKSSVVRAGLLAAVKRGKISRSQLWAQITMRPFDNPSEQIQSAMLDLRDINLYLGSHPGTESVLLFVDQFEELFTLCAEEVRNRFVDELSQALENPKLLLVISMRDEFYSAFHTKAAPLAESDKLTIVNIPGSLKYDELMSMIERPAAAVGLSLEEGLAERMVEDLMRDRAAPSSTLPLLEFALTELWEARRDGMLTHESYQNIDGVTGSLARWADTAFSELPRQDREPAKALLTSLVHLGDKAQALPDSRRRRSLRDLETSASNSRILAHFVNKRLIVTGDDAVELIHDALLIEWHQFSTWLEEDRDFLTWQQKMMERCEEWENQRADLLQGLELKSAQSAWAKRRRDAPKTNDIDRLEKFMSLSVKRSQRAFWTGVTGLVALLILLITAAAFVQNQRITTQSSQQTVTADAATQKVVVNIALQTLQAESTRASLESTRVANAQATAFANGTLANENAQQASEQEILKIAENLSADASSRINANYVNRLLLGVESYRLLEVNKFSQGHYPDVLPDLLDNMPAGFIRTLHPGSGSIPKVMYAPNGKWMVSLSDEIHLWDIADPSAPKLVTGWQNPDVGKPSDVTFSPDGKLLVLGYQDGPVEIWDVSTSNVTNLNTLQDFGSQSSGIKVAVSSDGKVLAASGNRTIKIWDLSNPRSPQFLGDIDHPHEILDRGVDINYLNFVPGSQSHFLVSGGRDNFLRIWNLAKYDYNPSAPDGNALPFDTEVPHVAVSAKFMFIADTKSIRVFLYTNNEREFAGSFPYAQVHPGAIEDLIISPNNKELYTIAQDGSIAEWDLTDPRHIKAVRRFSGPIKRLSSLALHPKADFLAVGGENSSIAIWNLAQHEISPMWNAQILNEAAINDVAYSPTSGLLALGDEAGSIILWNVTDPFQPEFRRETSIRNPIRHVAFSPDETALVFLGDTKDTHRPASYRRELARLDFNENQYLFGTNTADIFAAGNRYILAGLYDEGKLSVFHWDTAGLTITRGNVPLHATECPFRDTASFQNGGLVAVASCNVQLWDFSEERVPTLLRELEAVNPGGVAFNADGTLLVSANENNSISIWRIRPNEEPVQIAVRSAHSGEVTSVAISPDGKTLASGGADRTVILWDITDPENPIQRLELRQGHSGAMLNGGLVFLEGGRVLVSVSKREVILWDVDPRSWLEKACHIAGRNFTESEWQQFIGATIPYHATCPEFPVPER